MLRRPVVRAALALGAVAAVAGLWWFQPHKLFVDSTVDEALPAAAITEAPKAAPPPAPDGTAAAVTPAPEEPAGPQLLAGGPFRSLNRYETTGTAGIYQLDDGSRVLRLEDFATSNGPDLQVWLSSAPAAAEGREYAEGFVDLGTLKGNIGNQNYTIPADVDLAEYRSVVIWCRRFTVGFGSAPIT
jgi:hypothetical protein